MTQASDPLFTRLQVEIKIKNRIVGGIPTDPELIKGWIAANMPDVVEDARKQLAEKTVAELPQATEEKASGMWTTFKKDGLGIYMEGRQFKAMLKEVANILRERLIKSDPKNVAGERKSRYTNLKAKLAERLFVEDERVYFARDGKNLTAPDGNEERAIHVITAMGPRTALKRVDFVQAPAALRFTVRYLNDGIVDHGLVETLLEYASWNGVGADRSQGNGLFAYEIAETR